jgi:hypothetical protein
MKVIEDRQIGSLWNGNWFEGDEPRLIKEPIRKLVEERTFQVVRYKRSVFRKKTTKSSKSWMPI